MGKRGRIRRLGFACALVLFAPAARALECQDGAITVRGDWGQAQFTIEVADDDEERAQGLMHRESMASSAGMLFVYDQPRTARFWMKNTLIPLDLIFADVTGTVQKVHQNAEPLSEELIFGGTDVQYVLEINGGLAARLGIGSGDQLRHPAIDADSAVWPC